MQGRLAAANIKAAMQADGSGEEAQMIPWQPFGGFEVTTPLVLPDDMSTLHFCAVPKRGSDTYSDAAMPHTCRACRRHGAAMYVVCALLGQTCLACSVQHFRVRRHSPAEVM